MKIINTGVVLVVLLAASGCMHNQRSSAPQGGAASTTGSASTPPATSAENEKPLSNIERADQLIGEDVLASDQQSSGKIDDFVINQESGQILYAIVGIGGVLGVGETRVAVPPDVFTDAQKGNVRVNVDKHKLAKAPELPHDTAKRSATSFLNKMYGYFGEPAGRQRSLPSAESLKSTRMASELQGMTVQNNAHQEMGKVANVVLNVPAGLEMYIVISPGSDLNLGDNLYALPPGAVKLSSDQKMLLADITRDKLFHAPRFADNEWPEISKRSWAQQDYQYYGQSFQSGELQPTGRTSEPKQTSPKQ